MSSPGPPEILVIPVEGMKRVQPGDDLATLILEALEKKRFELKDDDILVVTQKVVSKAEGRLVALASSPRGLSGGKSLPAAFNSANRSLMADSGTDFSKKSRLGFRASADIGAAAKFPAWR